MHAIERRRRRIAFHTQRDPALDRQVAVIQGGADERRVAGHVDGAGDDAAGRDGAVLDGDVANGAAIERQREPAFDRQIAVAEADIAEPAVAGDIDGAGNDAPRYVGAIDRPAVDRSAGQRQRGVTVDRDLPAILEVHVGQRGAVGAAVVDDLDLAGAFDRQAAAGHRRAGFKDQRRLVHNLDVAAAADGDAFEGAGRGRVVRIRDRLNEAAFIARHRAADNGGIGQIDDGAMARGDHLAADLADLLVADLVSDVDRTAGIGGDDAVIYHGAEQGQFAAARRFHRAVIGQVV